jgi:hypothetical protein
VSERVGLQLRVMELQYNTPKQTTPQHRSTHNFLGSPENERGELATTVVAMGARYDDVDWEGSSIERDRLRL